jgi:hypothetical protein
LFGARFAGMRATTNAPTVAAAIKTGAPMAILRRLRRRASSLGEEAIVFSQAADNQDRRETV